MMRKPARGGALAALNLLLLLLCALLRFAPGGILRIGHACPALGVCFTVAAASFSDEWRGVGWGLFTGMVFDALSADTLIFYTLSLGGIGLAVGLLMTYLLNANRQVRLLLPLLAAAVFHGLDWLCHYVIPGRDAGLCLVRIALPSFLYTASVGIVFGLLYELLTRRLRAPVER